MRLFGLLLALLPLVAAQNKAPSTFSQRVIFTPPSTYTDPRVLYARTAQLTDGTILATWENYSPEPPAVYFPIYRSTDGGYSWTQISKVTDQGYGWGLRYQPFLYVLPSSFAGYPAGTVLLSGSSIPTNLSKTQIDIYASKDNGTTWEFLSHIAAGGVAKPNNGETPVWEPFLLLHNQRLICYYSDQRDTKHGQKMVHQTTTDLKTWGSVVDDVAYSKYSDRPGMPTVALLPNGKYIMAYEYGGSPLANFATYYKIASDPEQFGGITGVPLKTTDGGYPTSSPYIVWSSAGGSNGTLIVSAYSSSQVFINTALGEGSWKKVNTPEGGSYTRQIRVLQDPKKLLLIGAGKLPPSTTNKVTVSVMDIPT
ncbi:BNR/Asp-box repeat protein [Polyplosphaeria fusca]|uniref:BNR/Asp-box repeat protein n=1 Tax=Polyplosphaeria fusca TaxID=682080 RepID=A0A9P4QJS2_9PLEO|nr:BNR/Asp-box repeat protein [Polyplosphaeria fusca]